MKEHEIRSADDLKAALILDDFLGEARKYAAQQKMGGKMKRKFMRGARLIAEQQVKTKG